MESIKQPHSVEAERLVLGAIISGDEYVISKVTEKLESQHFYLPAHRIIYDSVLELYKNHKPIDAFIVGEELRKRDKLDIIGGLTYITDLINVDIISSAHIDEYINIVYGKFLLRRLISTGKEIVKMAYDESKSVDDIIDQSEQLIFTVKDEQVKTGFVAVKDMLPEIIEDIEKRVELTRSKNRAITGLETGFYELDKKIGGLNNGDLVIIAGRPSMGKTSLALNMAYHISRNVGKSVGIFSLEMSVNKLIDRFISMVSRIENRKLVNGYISDDEWDDLTGALSDLNKVKIFISKELRGLDVFKINAMARRLKAEQDVSCIFIDYIGLVSPFGNSRVRSRQEQIAEISKAFKLLANELNIPVVVLSQLSRKTEQRDTKRPELADLRDSGAIEQDADVVMLLYNADFYKQERKDPSLTEVIIAKNRNGPIGKINLTFNASCTKFENYVETEEYIDMDQLDNFDDNAGDDFNVS